MLSIGGFEAKRSFIIDFLTNSTYDCQVIVSEDESEDIEVINQVLRESSTGTTYNTVLCVGAETPVFITPREGISTKSKIILVVDVVPDTWKSKVNVATWQGVLADTASSPIQINKIEILGESQNKVTLADKIEEMNT